MAVENTNDSNVGREDIPQSVEGMNKSGRAGISTLSTERGEGNSRVLGEEWVWKCGLGCTPGAGGGGQ